MATTTVGYYGFNGVVNILNSLIVDGVNVGDELESLNSRSSTIRSDLLNGTLIPKKTDNIHIVASQLDDKKYNIPMVSADEYGYAECKSYSDLWFNPNTTTFNSKNISVGGSLTVSGSTSLYSDCDVKGNLGVSGSATMYSDCDVKGDFEVLGSATLQSDCNVYGDLYVTGSINTYGPLYVTGTATLFSDCDVYGDLTVTGSTTMYDGLTVPSITLNGNDLQTTLDALAANTLHSIDSDHAILADTVVVSQVNGSIETPYNITIVDGDGNESVFCSNNLNYTPSTGLLKTRQLTTTDNVIIGGTLSVTEMTHLYSNCIVDGSLSNEINIDF